MIVRALARHENLLITAHSCGFGNLATGSVELGHGGSNFGMDWADVVGFMESLELQGLLEGKKLVVIRGEGRGATMGLGTLLPAFLRGGPFTAIIMNNENYATAGNHLTSMSPWHANGKSLLKGKEHGVLPAAMLVSLAGAKYSATAIYGYPEDLIAKVDMALARQPSYLEVLHSCETGWHYPVEMSVKLSRLAVRTDMFPLYQWLSDGGRALFRRTVKVKDQERLPVIEYVKYQRRFAHMGEEDIADLHTFIDNRASLIDRLEEAFKQPSLSSSGIAIHDHVALCSLRAEPRRTRPMEWLSIWP